MRFYPFDKINWLFFLKKPDTPRALEAKEKSTEKAQIILPGFGSKDIQSLVKETLEKASHALERTTNVNKAILICGAALVIASFVVASITQHWEAVVFGGFGISGIIASLISNPLKSIGMGARRLVQIQVAYMGFLKQLSILSISPKDDSKISIEKSKQLDEATKNILKAIEQHFG